MTNEKNRIAHPVPDVKGFVRPPAEGETATPGIKTHLDSVGERLAGIFAKVRKNLETYRELRRRYLEDCKRWKIEPNNDLKTWLW